MRFGGLGGLGSHFDCEYNEKIARKLRRIILLHFGLLTLWIHDWKARKHFISMVLGPGGRDHDSQNQLFLIWETPRCFKNFKKLISFPKRWFGEIREFQYILDYFENVCSKSFASVWFNIWFFESWEFWNFETLERWNFLLSIKGIPSTSQFRQNYPWQP